MAWRLRGAQAGSRGEGECKTTMRKRHMSSQQGGWRWGYICFVRKGKMQGEEMGNDNPKEYCSKQKGEKRARIKDKENYDG